MQSTFTGLHLMHAAVQCAVKLHAKARLCSPGFRNNTCIQHTRYEIQHVFQQISQNSTTMKSTYKQAACSQGIIQGTSKQDASCQKAALPFAGSVRTSSAPKALSKILRSRDMEAGMVSTSWYPRAAAIKARPMPVLPDVGSTRVVCIQNIPFGFLLECFGCVELSDTVSAMSLHNRMQAHTEHHVCQLGCALKHFAGVLLVQME